MDKKRCGIILVIYIFILNLSRLCFGLDCKYCRNKTGRFNNSQSITLKTNGHLDESKEIDNYIYSLNYNRDEILAYKGESITSRIPKKEGKIDYSKNFIVITREKKSIFNGKADIGVLTSNEHRTYPGSLLLANSHLIENMPDVLVVKRSPIKYTLNLPRLTTNLNFITVPKYSNYKQDLNEVLNVFFHNYPNQSVPAIFQSDCSIAYNKYQLRVELGLEFKYSGIEQDIDFNAIAKKEKSVVIYRFKQIFYTVSVELPEKPSDLFHENVTLEDITREINNENPPVLVDSVSYGRVVYLQLETSSTDKETKNFLRTHIFTLSTISGKVDYYHKLKDVSMRLYVLGGSYEQTKLVEAKTVNDILGIVIKYGTFNSDNLGYPIYYTSEFIKDNSRALVKGSTEYIETTTAIFKKGIIKLSHTGWYVAKWIVDWDEVAYDSYGNKYSRRVSWHKNNDHVTAPFREEIELQGNVKNIRVIAREQTGLIWEGWRTVISRSGIPLVNYREFSIWGTTLNPKYSIKPNL